MVHLNIFILYEVSDEPTGHGRGEMMVGVFSTMDKAKDAATKQRSYLTWQMKGRVLAEISHDAGWHYEIESIVLDKEVVQVNLPLGVKPKEVSI
jgi:hypothetical protein